MLGRLADQAAKGQLIYLRRRKRLLRLALVKKAAQPIPLRPFGYFKFDDELTALANRSMPSTLLSPEGIKKRLG